MAICNININFKPSAVSEIIDTDLGTAVICAFMNMAYQATIVLDGKLSNCGGTATIDEIQKLLSAHYITLMEPETMEESVGGEARVRFRGDSGMGLQSSRYGQMALDMDCSGLLQAAADGQKPVGLRTFGYGDFE